MKTLSRLFGPLIVLIVMLAWVPKLYAACTPAITSPAANSTISGIVTVAVTANCTGNDTWFIRLYVNGPGTSMMVATAQSTGNAASLTFDTTTVLDGVYTLTVIIWDNSGLVRGGGSTPITYTIANGVSGSSPTPIAAPTPSPVTSSGACAPVITLPVAGTILSGNVSIGITSNNCANGFIRLYIGEATVKGGNSISFNTTLLPNGNYTMGAIYWDDTGLVIGGVSAPVSYTIANGGSGASPTATPNPTSSAAPTASPTPAPSSTPTPVATGFQPIGNPPLPPGTTQWVLTFDDEFNTDGSLNTSLWNGGGGVPSGDSPVFCTAGGLAGLGYGAPCPDEYYGTLGTAPYETLNPGTGAQVQAKIQNNETQTYWAELQSHGLATQKYGYWEIDAKMPHDNAGEGDGAHPDIWLTNPCRTSFQPNVFEACTPVEVDVAENFLSTQACATHAAHPSVWEGNTNLLGGNNGANTPTYDAGDLSAAFHAYGAQWAPPGANGSTGSQGSWQIFFDGNASSRPVGVNDPSWANGVYTLFGEEFVTAGSPLFGWCGTPATANTSNNDPMTVKYVRIWQAQ
jgi:hypothetical protein